MIKVLEKMEVWDKVDKPDKKYLKEIRAGRLKGKSDINPQWRIKVMTEVFGVCGIGWTYDIVKYWCVPLETTGEVMCFCHLNLRHRLGAGEWSEAIPGVGGSMLVKKESAGLHVSDEGYKMAMTDALGVAMKALGVAAEVYFGNYDGSKYVGVASSTARKSAPAKQSVSNSDEAAESSSNLISQKQIALLNVLLGQHDINGRDEKIDYVSGVAGRVIDSSKELTKQEASVVIDSLK